MMKRVLEFILWVVIASLASVVIVLNDAHAQTTFNKYGPAAGVQKNTGATYQNTTAVAGDIYGLWTGTCSASTFLRGDGACAAAGGGSGTVTSVALTMPTGFSVGGSPVTSSGTLAVTTALSGVLKGTGSGFTTSTNSDIIGLWTGTCSASTFLRGDGACAAAGGGGSVSLTGGTGITASPSTITGTGSLAVDQAFSPTWTGFHTFTVGAEIDAPTGVTGLAMTAGDTVALMTLQSGPTTDLSFGINLNAGTSFNDYALDIKDTTGAKDYFKVAGDGSVTVGDSSQAGIFTVLGTMQVAPLGAGPPLQVTTCPGCGLIARFDGDVSGSGGVTVNSGVNSGQSSFAVNNVNTSTHYFEVFGDGGVTVGSPTGSDQGIGTVNATGLFINGVAVGGGPPAPIACTTACNVSAIAVGQTAFIQKGANTTRTSNATRTADPDLQFTNMPVGIYQMSYALQFSGSSAGGDSASLLPVTGGGFVFATGSSFCGVATVADYFNLDSTGQVHSCTSNVANPNDMSGVGVLDITATPTTMAIAWAQNTSSGTGTVLVAAQSFYSITRIH